MAEKFSLNLAVRKLSRRRGLSVNQIAANLGVKERVVYQTLKHDSPTMATCERYAEVLGVPLLQLITEGYPKTMEVTPKGAHGHE